jgi:hypothetical protein
VLRAGMVRHPGGLRNCGIIDLSHAWCKNIHRADAPAAEFVQKARLRKKFGPVVQFSAKSLSQNGDRHLAISDFLWNNSWFARSQSPFWDRL